MPLLEVEGLHAGYDGIPVLHGVDLFVDDGEAVALRGRTGAGKTTTLLAVAGLLGRTAGRILYDGRPTTRSDPATLVERGLVLVPQGRHVFGGLDVEENRTGGNVRQAPCPRPSSRCSPSPGASWPTPASS